MSAADEWVTPAELRQRPDAEHIECQAVVSGRWKPLADRYWNDCVIPVKWRLTKAGQQAAEQEPLTRTWLVQATFNDHGPKRPSVEVLVPVTMATTMGADPVVEAEHVCAQVRAMLKPFLSHTARVQALVSMEAPTNAVEPIEPAEEAQLACPRCPSYNTELAILPDSWRCLDCGHTFAEADAVR